MTPLEPGGGRWALEVLAPGFERSPGGVPPLGSSRTPRPERESPARFASSATAGAQPSDRSSRSRRPCFPTNPRCRPVAPRLPRASEAPWREAPVVAHSELRQLVHPDQERRGDDHVSVRGAHRTEIRRGRPRVRHVFEHLFADHDVVEPWVFERRTDVELRVHERDVLFPRFAGVRIAADLRGDAAGGVERRRCGRLRPGSTRRAASAARRPRPHPGTRGCHRPRPLAGKRRRRVSPRCSGLPTDGIQHSYRCFGPLGILLDVDRERLCSQHLAIVAARP